MSTSTFIHATEPASRPRVHVLADAVSAAFDVEGHEIAVFLPTNRETLAETAAVLRVLADQIDRASDQVMVEQIRKSVRLTVPTA